MGGVFLRTYQGVSKHENYGSRGPLSGKQRGQASVGFCWGFCAVVCLTFGLASFLMLSAWGRFSGMAWGSVDNDGTDTVGGFITVEISEAERDASRKDKDQAAASSDSEPKDSEDAASNLPLSGSMLAMQNQTEDFGPLPKDLGELVPLSDYENIVLNAEDDGTGT